MQLNYQMKPHITLITAIRKGFKGLNITNLHNSEY